MKNLTEDIIERVKAGKPDRTSKVALDALMISPEVQIRQRLDERRIRDYKERVEAGEEPPPGLAVQDGETLWQCDAIHRGEALRRSGRKEMLVHIYFGTKEDAGILSGWANIDTPLELKRDEKREYIKRLRRHPAYRELSAREIARQFKIANSFVSSVDKELSVLGEQIPTRRTASRGGKTYQIETAKKKVTSEDGASEKPSVGRKEKPSLTSGKLEIEKRDREHLWHFFASSLDRIGRLNNRTVKVFGEPVIPPDLWKSLSQTFVSNMKRMLSRSETTSSSEREPPATIIAPPRELFPALSDDVLLHFSCDSRFLLDTLVKVDDDVHRVRVQVDDAGLKITADDDSTRIFALLNADQIQVKRTGEETLPVEPVRRFLNANAGRDELPPLVTVLKESTRPIRVSRGKSSWEAF